MASTGKNYQVEVSLYVDTVKSLRRIRTSLKEIQKKIPDIKLSFDVDTEKFKTVKQNANSLKQTFKDLDYTVLQTTKNMPKNFSDTAASIKASNSAAKQGINIAKNQQKSVSLLGDTWVKAFESITRYNIIADTLYGTKQAISEMVSNVIELDNHLVELQKVTDLEGESLTAFTKKAYEAGEGLSKTGTEIIDSATSFAKSGYDPDMALELGKIASWSIQDEYIVIYIKNRVNCWKPLKSYKLQHSQ